MLRARGIDPDGEIARARGYASWSEHEARAEGFTGMHARDTLAIPNVNLAGEFDDHLLRPHNPPIDPDTGKARKYMWRTGHTPALGGPPTGTPEWEARTHRLREDLNTPVIVTESILKGDCVLSHAEADVYTVSIHGTWNWSVNGAPTPETRNIPWRRKQHQRIVFRRLTVLVPDSDYSIKPEVAFAWWTFGRMLQYRGADVHVFHLPAAADGSKLGPDDALVSGVVTVAQMIDGAVPLGEIPAHALTVKPNTEHERIAHLEAELARANALISAQARLLKTPELKDKQRALGYSALTLAAHKASRGEMTPDGRVSLSAAEISNDWRPKPGKGEPTPETNQDGSRPLARRETVKSTLLSLADVVDVELKQTVRTHANGDRYKDTDILIKPGDLPTAIIELASYQRQITRKPYTRQEPCPHCGEVHSHTRFDYCDGCGAEIDQKHIPVPAANRPVDELTPDNLVMLNRSVSASGKFAEAESDNETDSPAPLTNCQENLRRQVPDASGIFVEADSSEPRVPLMSRCDWRLGDGETCGDPTEDWITGGFGSTHLCERHASRARRSGSMHSAGRPTLLVGGKVSA